MFMQCCIFQCFSNRHDEIDDIIIIIIIMALY